MWRRKFDILDTDPLFLVGDLVTQADRQNVLMMRNFFVVWTKSKIFAHVRVHGILNHWTKRKKEKIFVSVNFKF